MRSSGMRMPPAALFCATACVAALFSVSCMSPPDRDALAAEYMILADGYAGLEKYDQALFFYERASAEPAYKNAASYGIGRMHALSGNWKEAAKVFADLYEQEPENEILISAYAYALAASGDTEEALPLYREMLARHPDDARFHVDYVELLFAAELYDAAREEAAALSERFPNNTELSALSDLEERIAAALTEPAEEDRNAAQPDARADEEGAADKADADASVIDGGAVREKSGEGYGAD